MYEELRIASSPVIELEATRKQMLAEIDLSGDSAPNWLGDLPCFVASALLERIERRLRAPGASQQHGIDDLSTLCEESAGPHA
jgi:hypothetical protein